MRGVPIRICRNCRRRHLGVGRLTRADQASWPSIVLRELVMVDQDPFLEERTLELVPHLRPPFDVGFWSTSLSSVVRALWLDNKALLAASAQFKRHMETRLMTPADWKLLQVGSVETKFSKGGHVLKKVRRRPAGACWPRADRRRARRRSSSSSSSTAACRCSCRAWARAAAAAWRSCGRASWWASTASSATAASPLQTSSPTRWAPRAGRPGRRG